MIDFEMVLPEGWVVLPTAPDTDRVRNWAIDRIVKESLPDTLPRDKAEPWRRELRKQLRAATDDAGRHGARWVLLPLKEFHGVGIPGSMLMTILEDQDPQDPERLLASILEDAGPDGTYVELDGAPAARVAAVTRGRTMGRSAIGRRVSYYFPHPDRAGVWGLLTFTVLSDGDVEDPGVRAIVFLFDTIVSTVRWTERDGAPTEDEVLAMLGVAVEQTA